MSDNSFPFRRTTDPLILTVSPVASQFTVPTNFFSQGAGKNVTSFWVVNPNNFWVRLRGSSLRTDQEGMFVPVTEDTGWLFGPGFAGAFTTQFPNYMSTMSVTYQGLTAGNGRLEISYGGGA